MHRADNTDAVLEEEMGIQSVCPGRMAQHSTSQADASVKEESSFTTSHVVGHVEGMQADNDGRKMDG